MFLSALFLLGSALLSFGVDARQAVSEVKMPIVLQQTRLILQNEERRAHLTLANEGDFPVMMTASVYSASKDMGEGQRSTGLMVTPPTKLLMPHRSETLRIVLLEKNLPKDRESLYYLRLKFLPSVEESQKELTQLAGMLTLYAKIFVRPEAIAGRDRIRSQCSRLSVVKTDDRTTVIKNPSPYWMTIPAFTLDGHRLDRAERAPVIAPFGVYEIPAAGRRLEFNCVLEGGRYSETEVRLTE